MLSPELSSTESKLSQFVAFLSERQTIMEHFHINCNVRVIIQRYGADTHMFALS